MPFEFILGVVAFVAIGAVCSLAYLIGGSGGFYRAIHSGGRRDDSGSVDAGATRYRKRD